VREADRNDSGGDEVNTPTPETDAHYATTKTAWPHGGDIDFARKLERERDEAQRIVREQHAQIIGLYAQEAELRNERDEARRLIKDTAPSPQPKAE
jgi:hypothetical protein